MASLGVEARAESSFVSQNISGFNLPGVTLPSGSDEVRAADGTTCRSALGSHGAYLDVGLIGNPETDAGTAASVSAYGRMVIPLGKKPKRLDCSRLYDLEVQRLEMELKLAQMGLAQGISPVSDQGTSTNDDPDSTGSDWADDGWTKDGLNEETE